MRIPGFNGAIGGDALVSEASARGNCQRCLTAKGVIDGVVRMPLGSSETVVLFARGLVDFAVESFVIVEVDEERLNVLASGARCVSLSSVDLFVSIAESLSSLAGLTFRQLPRHDG